MVIFKFKSEEDYNTARDILIEMHEKTPPQKTEPLNILAVRDIESSTFASLLFIRNIKHESEAA